MKAVIFHGVRASIESPRHGREDHELWCVTRANDTIPGNGRHWGGTLTDWTRWFDLHPWDPHGPWPGLKASRAATLAWYAHEPADGRPIYMAERRSEIPASRAYPIEAMRQYFAVNDGDGFEPSNAFGCMIDYLFALALYEGFDRIVLNGVGMSHDHGHIYVHRTIGEWIAFARGRDVQVFIEGDSCYRNSRKSLYGYERFGYDELNGILGSYGMEPDDRSDMAPFRALSKDWRVQARPQPTQYADELDHVLSVIQREQDRR